MKQFKGQMDLRKNLNFFQQFPVLTFDTHIRKFKKTKFTLNSIYRHKMQHSQKKIYELKLKLK